MCLNCFISYMIHCHAPSTSDHSNITWEPVRYYGVSFYSNLCRHMRVDCRPEMNSANFDTATEVDISGNEQLRSACPKVWYHLTQTRALSGHLPIWGLENIQHPGDPAPDDLFLSTDPAVLNTHLSRFVLETQKTNGENYPPKTLHLLLCGPLRCMRNVNHKKELSAPNI